MKPSLLFSNVLAVVVLAAVPPARAAPWFDAEENALEESYADGDLDTEDHAALRLTGQGGGARGAGTADVHGQSWVSVLGFASALAGGKSDVGGGIVVGVALDRIAAGPVHRIADGPATPASSTPRTSSDAAGLVPPAFAAACVEAALRASGLGADDARIDAIAARARASASLPETRLRVMRLWSDASHDTTLGTVDATDYYAAVQANLIMEARLTWRLDRLLYAGDEPALERTRLERIEARSRLADRALQALFAWARARFDAREAVSASREAGEAELRVAETEATLEVLTGGWFSSEEGRRFASR
jgi:hypothetical protein